MTALLIDCEWCGAAYVFRITERKRAQVYGDNEAVASLEDVRRALTGEERKYRDLAESLGLPFIDGEVLDVIVCGCGDVIDPVRDMRAGIT